MSKCTTVHQLFKKVHNELEQHYSTRQHFYIAGDLLRLFEQCGDPSFIDGKEDFMRAFNAAFYYFLKTSRLDDAERIFHAGFSHKNLEKIVFLYRDRMVKSGKAADKLVFPVYLDRLLSFFAQIGKEGEVLELENSFTERQVPGLANLTAVSWTRLAHTFLTGYPDKDHFPLFQRMNKLSRDYIKSDFRKIILDEKSVYDPIIKNKKLINLQAWLLKRQMLGIYAGICAYLPTGNKQEKAREDLLFNNLSLLCRDVVENYAYLIHYTVHGYLYAAIRALENCTEDGYKPQWYGDIIDNLKNQLEYTRYRHAEVTDFFKETMALPFLVTCPDKLITALNKVGLEDVRKKSPEQQLDVLKILIPEQADNDEPRVLYGPKKERETLTELKNRIEKAVRGAAFKEFCRKRFTFPRLKVLTVSLDNLYSTGSAFFFQNHGIRTERTRKIDTELCIMKKWGSTGGMFQRERYINTSYGGGFFLFHNGFGLAIDPGPDFLKLLVQHSDFTLLDINGVTCSHPHRDHSAEFPRILTGIREYNRSAGFKRLYYLFPHKEDCDIIYPAPMREKYAVDISADSKEDGVYFFPDGQCQWGRTHGIRVQSIKVTHRIHQGRENSYGLLVSPLKEGKPLVNILFSGDARYRPGLFESIDAEYKPDLLILNIASTLIDDITALEPGAYLEEGSDSIQKNHLGYAGLQSILNRLHGYQAAVINEFYEIQSLLDGRLLITNTLENDIHDTTENGNPFKNIFCVEPGLRFRFKAGETGGKSQIDIFCSHLCSVSENGFVPIPETEIEQFKQNLSCRRTPILMTCGNCPTEKKELFGVENVGRL
jgi:hypothetical protein